MQSPIMDSYVRHSQTIPFLPTPSPTEFMPYLSFNFNSIATKAIEFFCFNGKDNNMLTLA